MFRPPLVENGEPGEVVFKYILCCNKCIDVSPRFTRYSRNTTNDR